MVVLTHLCRPPSAPCCSVFKESLDSVEGFKASGLFLLFENQHRCSSLSTGTSLGATPVHDGMKVRRSATGGQQRSTSRTVFDAGPSPFVKRFERKTGFSSKTVPVCEFDYRIIHNIIIIQQIRNFSFVRRDSYDRCSHSSQR